MLAKITFVLQCNSKVLTFINGVIYRSTPNTDSGQICRTSNSERNLSFIVFSIPRSQSVEVLDESGFIRQCRRQEQWLLWRGGSCSLFACSVSGKTRREVWVRSGAESQTEMDLITFW